MYFKEGSQQSRQKNTITLLTRTWLTTNLLPELPLVVQTRPPFRIISIVRRMEDPNRFYGDSDIMMDGVKQNGWELKDAS